jgi:SNF2 family DNA or RNA helicase
VQFLWDCVSGRRSAGLSGCILAHSMGLGKSLSALTLLFTLLKTGPTAASERAGTIRKALIVCPASLCKNWEKEVKRWLPQRLRPTLLPTATLRRPPRRCASSRPRRRSSSSS